MEGLQVASPFVAYVKSQLQDHPFTMIDVGCSGGIDKAWLAFEPNLRAFGFDPNLGEVARLSSAGRSGTVEYIAAFVSAERDNPYPVYTQFWERNPMGRTSAWHTTQRVKAPDSEARSKMNLWHVNQLAPDSVFLPDFLQARGLSDVDFVKIDVDGGDFRILQSLRDAFEQQQILGVGVEVNYFGSANPEMNAFHNIDRLMREVGFELFALTTRQYSVAALPAPYLEGAPGPTAWGRPLQGDAIYVRDAAAPEMAAWSAALSPHKLIKLAALFSLLHLPDCAAEVLQCFAGRIGQVISIEEGIASLMKQCGLPASAPADYLSYKNAFEADAPFFYPRPNMPKASPFQAIRLADSESSASWLECVLHNSTQVSGDAPHLSFVTQAVPYAYAVMLRLDPAMLKDRDDLMVEVHLVVKRGNIGVGLLTADGTEVVHEQNLDAEPASIAKVVIPFAAGRSFEGLLFRGGIRPEAGEVDILRIELWQGR